MTRRMVILAEGKFSPLESKTANQAIRYLPEEVVGVIDSRTGGMTIQQVLGFGGTIPVFPDLRASLVVRPNTLLIGIAPTGGQLPDAWRPIIKEAIAQNMTVIGGLHTLLTEDQEFAGLAQACGVSLIDLRKVPEEYNAIARGSWRTRSARTILTVGTDCNVGKMTAAIEIHRALQRRGKRSDFIATGQTGILLSGKGVAVDHLLSDFVAGAVEKLVDDSTAVGNEVIIVEGQGALTHEGYSSVTMGLLHGVMPDAMILVHHPARPTNDYGLSLSNLGHAISLHEAVLEQFKRSKVIGIAVNPVGMNSLEVERAIGELEQTTKLPAADVLTKGIEKLADAVEQHMARLEPAFA